MIMSAVRGGLPLIGRGMTEQGETVALVLEM